MHEKRHEAYLYHVTFNAMHNMDIQNPKHTHAHTFRVGMYVIKDGDDNPEFLSTENILNHYFARYQGISVNNLHAFKDVVPTIENMCEVIYWELKPIFAENGMRLLFLELGDSPIATFRIGECLMVGNVYNMEEEKTLQAYCERVRKRYEKRITEEEE